MGWGWNITYQAGQADSNAGPNNVRYAPLSLFRKTWAARRHIDPRYLERNTKLVIQLDMKMKCAKGTPRRPIRDHIRRDRINIGLQDNSFVPLHTVIRPPPAPGSQLARSMAAARKPRICTLCETNRAGARVQRPICPPREPIPLLFQVVPNLRISFPALGSLQAFPDRKTVSGSFDTK